MEVRSVAKAGNLQRAAAATNPERFQAPGDQVPVRLNSPEKTIADCFKYRSKIGLDVAIEAPADRG